MGSDGEVRRGPRDRPGGWVVATLVVLACTGFVQYQNTPERSLGGTVGVERDAGPEYVALGVFQLRDCDQAAAYLRVFTEGPALGRFEVRGLVAGHAADVMQAVAKLGRDVKGVSVRKAARRDMVALEAIGYGATPYVLVIDRAGRLRWTSPPPRSPAEWSAFRQAVAVLATTTSNEEVR
ncbi:MAG TPA: hypothetical protein VM778_11010 [Gemmatimonadota bacterium]|nr:hypothetical protein [Gemmatimonadota bacterium]